MADAKPKAQIILDAAKVSALAYAGIPPITLRYLEQIHDHEGEEA